MLQVGAYEDYTIEKVFSSKEKAKKFLINEGKLTDDDIIIGDYFIAEYELDEE